jgi:predicted RNase H-like nuclease (RuvC/YqgF family)
MTADANSKPYGIVGFDPGNTSALAIVDFEGVLIFAGSGTGLSLEDAIGTIGENCVPAVFASDVAPAQEAVRKLAAAFGCRHWAPEISLSILEKRRIVFENTEGGLNVHERDALAAALFCLFSLTDLIGRAKRKTPDSWRERVYSVLKGTARNLSDEEKKEEERISAPKPREPDHLKILLMKKRILSLEGKLDEARKINSFLEGEARKNRPASSAIVRPKILVENKSSVERHAIELEETQRALSGFLGEEIVLLPLGRQIDSWIFVKDAARLGEREVLERKIKVVAASEIRSSLPCKVVRVRQSLFGGSLAIVLRKELELGREDEKRWNAAYLGFVAGKA